MRRIALSLALVCAMPALAAAQADSQPQVPVTFIDMEEIRLHGQRARPNAAYHEARRRARFASLVRLKKDVLPRIAATAKDQVLR